MHNLKKMLSNDSFADDKSNDLIRKTSSSRKPRVPAQGVKEPVKVENVTAFRMSFVAPPSQLLVCGDAAKTVRLSKPQRLLSRHHGEYFRGTEGPTKLTHLLNTSVYVNFHISFPSSQCELRCSLVLNWISAYLLPCLWLPLLFTCHFSLHQIDFFELFVQNWSTVLKQKPLGHTVGFFSFGK